MVQKQFVLILLLIITFGAHCQQEAEYYDKYNNSHYGLKMIDFNLTISDKSILQDTSLKGVNSLYDIVCDTLIILFYDPDCSHCNKVIKKLKKDKSLKRSLQSPRVKLLALTPDLDKDIWAKQCKDSDLLDPKWINAYSEDNDQIITKLLWKVPEKFVLDTNKRIININMYNQ